MRGKSPDLACVKQHIICDAIFNVHSVCPAVLRCKSVSVLEPCTENSQILIKMCEYERSTPSNIQNNIIARVMLCNYLSKRVLINQSLPFHSKYSYLITNTKSFMPISQHSVTFKVKHTNSIKNQVTEYLQIAISFN